MALAAAHKKIQSVVVSALLVHAGQEIPAEAVRYIYIYIKIHRYRFYQKCYIHLVALSFPLDKFWVMLSLWKYC